MSVLQFFLIYEDDQPQNIKRKTNKKSTKHLDQCREKKRNLTRSLQIFQSNWSKYLSWFWPLYKNFQTLKSDRTTFVGYMLIMYSTRWSLFERM